MTETQTDRARPRSPRPVLIGIGLYVGYLAVFFSTWIINRVDFEHIGDNAHTIKMWYAIPTLAGCAFLVVALSILGWWRAALFDTNRSGPAWAWILPIGMALIIAMNVMVLPFGELSPGLVLWSALGAVGVGFGEEMATRGSLVVGLRSRFNETQVWLISTLLFSALHIPNMFFGLPTESMLVQVVFAFIMGSGFYAVRRLSGTLIVPMVLHGLWDSSVFLNDATGSGPTIVVFAAYPLAIACSIAVLRRNRG